MGTAVLWAVYIIGNVVTVIAEVIAFVLVPIVAAITFITDTIVPIVDAITGVVKAVSFAISDPISRIANTITGGVLDGVAELNEKVIEPIVEMRKQLEVGIKEIAATVAGPFQAVIDPLKESLVSINGFVGGVEDQINADMKPIQDLTRLVRTLTSTKIATVLVGETQVMAETISWVTGKEGAAVGFGISQLWNSTVDSMIGISTALDDNIATLHGEVLAGEKRMRADQEEALRRIENQTNESIGEVFLKVQAQTDETNRRTASALRRIEDIPFFREMLVKALD